MIETVIPQMKESDMPRIQGTIPPAKPPIVPHRFSIASTIDGYEVVDRDGRAVSDSFDTANRALSIAADLNEAAGRGRRALSRAFGAIDDAFVAA
jgi:hypothetical protein